MSTNTTPPVETLRHVAPGELRIGTNVRLDPNVKKDRALIASIKDLGVLETIKAVEAEDGTLTVRYGQRRTLAAVEAGRELVPVIVVLANTEQDENEAEEQRIVEQMAENDHRAAITNGDRAAAYEQLAAIGLSAAQIARRTHRPKAEVETAAVVTRSKLAAQTAQRYEFMTLDDHALVAEFDDDKETVKKLVTAAKDGRSTQHVAEQARRARKAAQQRQELMDDLAARGVPVIEQPRETWDNTTGRAIRPTAQAIADLRESKDTTGPMTDEQHAACPGHAAYVTRRYSWESEVVYVCTDPKQYGHRKITATVSAPMTDEQRTERKRVIENNKAWDAAVTVRGEWIAKNLATGTKPPKAAERFIATAIVSGDHVAVGYGTPAKAVAGKVAKAAPGSALRIACHALISDWHDGTTGQAGRNIWRRPTSRDQRCMKALIAWGYPADDVERLVADAK